MFKFTGYCDYEYFQIDNRHASPMSYVQRWIKLNKLKTENNVKKIPKLEINIPSFSDSLEKSPKHMNKPVKSKSTSNSHYAAKGSITPIKIKQYKQMSKNNVVYHTKIRKQQQSPFANIIKNKTDAHTSKHYSHSPKNNKDLYNTKTVRQISKTNINTARNIDDIKKKMQPYKFSTRINNNKFFKKQLNICSQLEDMNRTLKKVAELKSRKQKYELKMIKKLGKSQTGDIILAVSNINGMIVAIKTFRKDKIKLEFLIDQMKIHLYCQHPNILPAYGFNVGRDQVYLVMEFGFHNLYEQILKKGPFDEHKTAKYIFQILSGIQYLHRNGVMHRDLKPENIICFGEHLKITDFGWSIKTDKQRKTLCGTLDYISPQVAQRVYYDNKIDCWSVGVLMYQMLTVQPPFTQQTNNFSFNTLRLPSHISQQCKNMLTRLLQINPARRLSARQALEHSWITFHIKVSENASKKYCKQLKNDLQQVFNIN